ncbi:MAG: hypothetical protein ACRD5L_04305 [Bryobacteraceae bacterium]
MLPTFMPPETVTRQNGASAEVALENSCRLAQFTLGITRILEHESLEVSIWGSADRQDWRLIAAFPQKSYCGTYLLLLDLAHHADLRFLRAQWKMGRWGNQERAPLFGFYLRVEEGRLAHRASAA